VKTNLKHFEIAPHLPMSLSYGSTVNTTLLWKSTEIETINISKLINEI